jgi:phosphoglycerate-specific signal transduction histidine kinase
MTQISTLKRLNPLASLSGKLIAILVVLGSIALVVGMMSLALFSSISDEMNVLANEKVQETKTSFAVSTRVDDVKTAILELVSADSVQGIEALRGEIDRGIATLIEDASQLPSQKFELVKSEANALKQMLAQLSALRAEEFTRSAEVARQSEEVQQIGISLQNAVIEAADEANFTIALGGETELESVEATLQDIATTKSEILQRILEVRADINLLSGLALASGRGLDQGTSSIVNDLGKASADRVQSAIVDLQDQDQIEIATSSLGSRLNQAHQMIVAAIATADRKLRASLS